MSAWKRDAWSVVSPGRLAEIIERLAAERRPERIRPAALEAALAATGARGGRLVGPAADGAGAPLTSAGEERGRRPVLAVEIAGGDATLGRLEVWAAGDDAEAEAALRMVAAVCARSLEHADAERDRAEDRARALRLEAAAAAVRSTREPRDAVARVLAEARALLGAPAAALLAAGSPSPEVAAYDGTEPLPAADLAALVPAPLRAELAEGGAWSGALSPDGALAARGLSGAALVGVGAGAGLGILAVFSASPRPLADPDLTALRELAGHAAASLTVSVLQQEVRELGAVDPLTRFFNGRYFRGRIDQECGRALRAGVPLSVAIMSLDGLEELRDEGRDSAAEAAVEALAGHVAERLRTMDVGCRLDGDELAAILPEVEGLDALRVCERLRAAVADVPALAGRFTLSVGVASFPSHAGRPDSLVDNARSALDWARDHGGDRTFLFHTDTAEILRREDREREAEDEAVLATVVSLAASVDARHPATALHSENVGHLAALLATEVGLAPEHAERVRIAGLLHDVGKIGVSDAIITAAAPLTPAQDDELRRHAEIGERMLSGSRLADVAPWVLHHHERMDGGGHPSGLRGGEIPLEARLIAVASAYDRLISGTPARTAIAAGDALRELERRAGAELDPHVVAALEALVGRGALTSQATPEETA